MSDQRLLPRHPVLKKYGNHRKQPLSWLSPWTNVLCSWEYQASSAPRKLSAVICNGTSCQDGEVTSHLWMRGGSVSTEIPLSCYKMSLLKCTMTGLEHASLKEEEVGVSGLSVSCSQSITHLTVLLPLVNMYALYNQSPALLNLLLPISLS